MINTSQLFTTAELATYLQVTTRHVYRMKKNNSIPYIQVGDALRYDVNDVVAQLRAIK
jgi:excisionase family DNA binding protein